jgi:hypothetical protein
MTTPLPCPPALRTCTTDGLTLEMASCSGIIAESAAEAVGTA